MLDPAIGPLFDSAEFCYCVHPQGDVLGRCATCGGRILDDPPEGASDYWQHLAPGVYDDGAGGLHLDVPELLAANGWPDTPENRDTVEAVAREMFGPTLGMHE